MGKKKKETGKIKRFNVDKIDYVSIDSEGRICPKKIELKINKLYKPSLPSLNSLGYTESIISKFTCDYSNEISEKKLFRKTRSLPEDDILITDEVYARLVRRGISDRLVLLSYIADILLTKEKYVDMNNEIQRY